MVRRVFVAALAALLVAGCGAGEASSAGEFTGEDEKVAQVLEDLQAAGTSGDAEEVCSRLLAESLVDSLSAGGATCVQELDDALGDADDFELDVQKVQVDGTRATATVANADGRAQEVRLVREAKGWRISELV